MFGDTYHSKEEDALLNYWIDATSFSQNKDKKIKQAKEDCFLFHYMLAEIKGLDTLNYKKDFMKMMKERTNLKEKDLEKKLKCLGERLK